jgi:hypothetical protein
MSEPEVPEEYTVEVEVEDGTEVVDLESLWSSAPPEGWEIHEGEIGLARPDGEGVEFRRLCAGMLATALSSAARFRSQMGTYEIRSFPGVDNLVVFDHVRAILERAGVAAQCRAFPDPESPTAGKVVGPVAVLDALASSPSSVIRRVGAIPPDDLKECLDLIESASRDESPLMHELAWASTIRIYKRLGHLLETVPSALEEARAKGHKITVVPMPDKFVRALVSSDATTSR